MKGRYTERAEKVLKIAHTEAKAMGHQVVGTEHILLGLIQEGCLLYTSPSPRD